MSDIRCEIRWAPATQSESESIEILRDTAGRPRKQLTRIHDSSGRTVRELAEGFDENGQLVQSQVDSYDARGRAVERVRWASNGSWLYQWVYEHSEGTDGRSVQSRCYNGSGHLLETGVSRFNRAGQIVETSRFDANGVLTKQHLDAYDSNGGLAKLTVIERIGDYYDMEERFYSDDKCVGRRTSTLPASYSPATA